MDLTPLFYTIKKLPLLLDFQLSFKNTKSPLLNPKASLDYYPFSCSQQSFLKDLFVLLPPTSPPIFSCTHSWNCFVTATKDFHTSPNPSGRSSSHILPHQMLTHFHLMPDTLSTQAFQDPTCWWWPPSSQATLSSSSLLGSLLSSTSQSPASLFTCPLVISSSVTSFNVIYIHADAQRSVSNPDLSSDIHIPKPNFLFNSYTSMPNNPREA